MESDEERSGRGRGRRDDGAGTDNEDEEVESRTLVEWIVFLSILGFTITATSIAICCICKYLGRLEQAKKRRAEA